jgi:hypothetical protein
MPNDEYPLLESKSRYVPAERGELGSPGAVSETVPTTVVPAGGLAGREAMGLLEHRPDIRLQAGVLEQIHQEGHDRDDEGGSEKSQHLEPLAIGLPALERRKLRWSRRRANWGGDPGPREARTAARRRPCHEDSIGAPGFEPGTSCSQSRRATGLRHTPS